jgi:SAM-dependent methyltransferase
MSHTDVYHEEHFARFYDWSCGSRDADIPFYIDFVREHGSPVLEVACGTGRVTIPLARAGFRTVGLDHSEPMLRRARAKIEREPVAVRKRMTLHHADMRRFELGERFGAVLVPDAALFHLGSDESLSACFSCLYVHTDDDGAVVVDVVAPARMADQLVGPERVLRAELNPATGRMTRELNRKLHIDKRAQTVRVLHTFEEEREDAVRRFAFEQSYRWLEKDEGVRHLRRAGFADVQLFGDYDRSAYSSGSPRLILTARRARGGSAL